MRVWSPDSAAVAPAHETRFLEAVFLAASSIAGWLQEFQRFSHHVFQRAFRVLKIFAPVRDLCRASGATLRRPALLRWSLSRRARCSAHSRAWRCPAL